MTRRRGECSGGMKAENDTMKLPFQKEYRSAMRSILTFAAIVGASLGLSAVTSCSTSPSVKLPFDLGVRYEVEPGVFIVATPADKGGMKLSLDAADGQLSEHLKHEGDVWTYSSPRTGIVYRITQRPDGRPLIEIIEGGDGRLQLVPRAVPAKTPA